MSGSKSRRKGQVGEREFLGILGDWLGRTLHRNHAQTDQGGSDSAELPVSLEIKRAKLFRHDWIEQTESQAVEDGKPPMLAYRLDRQEWRVLMVLTPAEAADVIRQREAEVSGETVRREG